ncbi:MAG TPA: MopE-related protein, partial [Polyangia bacterium]|nr:MopE-related protein [Polyangia bacterium]
MDRVARARVLVGCWAVIGATAAGCGQSKSKGPDMTGAADAALHVISTPVSYAKVGEDLKYQAVLSQPGAADWALAAAPQGAKIDQGGSLTWTPTDDQSGPQTVAINAALAGEQVTQTAHVTAASSVVQASAHVDPASVNGALIAVDAPLSPIQGAAVQLQPGALPPGHSVAVTVASMSNAPMPAAAAVAGIPPNEMRPVDFGPSGMAFQVPAQVHLPVRPSVLKKGRPEIQTYDYDTGRWQKIKVISVDEANGFVTGEIKHFSTYVVTPPSQAFDLRLGLGGAGSACAQALVVRPALAAAFDQIPASAVNGYAGSAASVADVLAGLAGGQALQVYTRVRAQAAAATGESIAWVLASATRLADGKLKISITTDSHGGAFLTTPPELDGGDSEVPAWLSGGRVDLIFSGLGSLGGGATADADVSFYVVPAGDADHPPPAAANAFAAEEVTQPSLMPMAGFDDDCDGAPNQWDPTPQGTPPPQLTGTPQGPIHVAVGSAAAFTASAGAAGTTFTWTASDPSVAIATTMAGAAATATPGKAGHFTVDAVGSNGASSSRLHWDLYADPAAVHATNTPPVVAIGASAVTVRAGERVVLNAYGKDAEQTDLTFSWYADDTSTLSAQAGSSIVFAAVAPGDYKVGCTASDGIASSTPAALVISVLSPMANRPPSAPLVTPTSVVLQHAAGVSVALALAASAADPDGDAVTYDFVPDRFTPPTFTLTKNGGSAMFTTAQDGLYLFYVTAKDSHGAVSAWTPAKIQVLPTLPAVPVDADKDGYPAGIDCNDNDPAIHPGAVEICGDGIDQNCDGQDLGVADCDADGDRFTINQGDCDDNNAAINPGAVERCDGIDNNCNGQVDEGFGIGVDCTAGVGACRVAATTICNAAFNGVVCGGNPGLPKPEVCDGIDNDCNGKVDDVTATAGGDVGNCGGCNIRCTAPANSVAACVKGGCTTACSPGWVDTDHNPDNGCECQITNGGVEICDGLDNDCNGSVDDGASAVFYDGATGTLGVGVCASGTRLCMGGKPVVVRAQQLPAPEICDGLDNDCNGVVDDGFDLSKDPRNCGACGIVCADGICQGGKCPGGLGGTGTGGAGGVTGADAGVRDAGGGAGGAGGFGGNGGGGSVMAICAGPTGTFCTDLGFDPGNC